MATPQHGLQPMIGYMMAMLGREGMTDERVLELARQQAQDRGWPQHLLAESLQWAISNRIATTRAQSVDYVTPLQSILGIPPSSGEMVGVRVVLQLALGQNAPAGSRDTASVVVNVSANGTASDAVAAAIELWNAQQTSPKNSSDRYSTAIAGSAVAVFEGGLEGGIDVHVGIK